MKRLLFSLPILLFAACGGSDSDPIIQENKMSINSCYIVRNNSLSENFSSPIGLYILNEFGQPYDASSYKNSAALISGSWQLSNTVYIIGKGTLFAYFPYSEGNEPTSLPVNVANQVDLLYTKNPVTITTGSASLDIRLHHAMSNISVDVEDEEIASLSLVSPLTGKFNVCSGAFSNLVNGTVSVPSGEMLVIPHTASGTELKITLMSGSEYTYSVSGTAFLPGESFTYHFKLNDNREQLEIRSFSVEEWGKDFIYNDYLK